MNAQSATEFDKVTSAYEQAWIPSYVYMRPLLEESREQ